MGRLVGVGFLVGAKDDGATETMDEVAESTDRVAESAERAGSEGSRNVGLLSRAISGLNTINISNISDSLASLAERAGTGIGAQSTSLESFGAQFNQTARAAEARLGSMSGAMRAHRGEVSSLAYTYGVSGDEMFAAMAPLSRIGVDIEETGINVRGLAGHLQAGMISGQAFGNMLSELIGTYEMAPEAAGQMVNSLTAIGDRFGFVAEVGQGMPALMDAIRPVAARYPDVAANVDGVATSITRLAAGMVSMGMAPEAAMQAATATFTNLADQRDAMTDLVTGVSTEFPQMAERIGIATGDIHGSVSNILEDPLTFARNMGEMMASGDMSDAMMQRLRGTLREISPELLNVINNAAEGGDALAQAAEPIEGVEDAFNRAGQSALTSTLTFQDQLDRMRDAFQTRMNSIGRRTMPDFMSRQRDAYRQVGDRIERFAADDGPLGTLTRGFLRVRTFGLVQGLLPQLGALGVDLGETAQMAGPLLLAMNQLGSMRGVSAVLGRVSGVLRIVGGRALMVLGPIGLIAGAGLLLYQYWDRIPGLLESVSSRLEAAGQWFQGIGERVINWAKGIDWAKVGRESMDRLFNAITSTIESLFAGDQGQGQVGSAIWSGLVNIFSGISMMIGGLATGLWERFTQGFTSELGGNAGIVQRIFGVYFRGIQANIQNVITVFSTLGRILITPFRAWWRVVQPIGAMVMRIFGQGQGEAQGFSNIIEGIVGFTERYQDVLLRGVENFERMADAVASWFEGIYSDAIDPIVSALQRDLPYIEEQFTKIFQDAREVFADVFAAIGEVGGVVWELWTDTFEPIFGLIWGLVRQVFTGTSEQSEHSFRQVGDNARGMWQRRIRPMLIGMVRGFAEAFNWILTNGTNLFTQLATRGGTAMIRIQTGIERVRAAWEGMQNIMRTGWEAVQTHTENIIGNMMDFVDLTFQRMLHGWRTTIMDLKIYLVDTFNSVLDVIQRFVNNIPAVIRQNVPALQAFAGGMERARTGLTELHERLGRERTAMVATHREEERELLRTMERRRQEMEQSRDAFSQARQDAIDDQRRIAQQGERRIRMLTDFYENLQQQIQSGTAEAYADMMNIAGRLERGEFGQERREAARGRRLVGVQRMGTALEGIGNLRADERRMLEQALMRRAGEGSALTPRDVENAVARLRGAPRRGGEARAGVVQELARAIERGQIIGAARPAPESAGGGRVARTARRRPAAGGGGVDQPSRVIVENPEDIGRATGEDIERRAGGPATRPAPGSGIDQPLPSIE